MPKNKGKGGNKRRRGKNQNETVKKALVFKEDGQEYAQVVKMLGNGRCECFCFDGTSRLGHIRGKMRKRVWINQGDIILVGLRDFQDGKCDVIQKYTPDEARELKKHKELPENAKINEGFVDRGEDDDIIEFEDLEDEDVDEFGDRGLDFQRRLDIISDDSDSDEGEAEPTDYGEYKHGAYDAQAAQDAMIDAI
jgi:translation initiation factor 1A